MGIIKSEVPTEVISARKRAAQIKKVAMTLYDVVGSTFGPYGRLVSFDAAGTIWPSYTKDGVTVAGQIVMKDKFERHIADTIIQAANRQLTDCGDGTTLTIILACRMLYDIDLEKVNNNQAKRELDEKIELIVKNVYSQAIPATDSNIQDIISVALNNDEKLKDLVSHAVAHVGDLGVIIPRFSRTKESYVEYDQGYQWRSGIKMGFEFCMNIDGGFRADNPLVMVVNDILTHEDDVMPVVAKILAHASEVSGVPAKDLSSKDLPALVIIAHNFEHRAVQYARKLKETGKLNVVMIQPEGSYGTSDRAYHMANVAAFTGATVIDGDAGVSKKNLTIKDLGSCRSVHADTQGTCFSGGLQDTIDTRINHLEAIKKQVSGVDPLEVHYVEQSIARLRSLVATINVAGHSESEIREKLDRVEDALKSVYSAKDGGVVPGGGIALLNADPENQLCGWVPIRKIFENASVSAPDNFFKCDGYDIENILRGDCQHTNKTMFELGIVDPANNIANALKNAASVVKCILDTSYFLIKEET